MNITIISLYYKPISPGYGTRSTQLYVDQATNAGNNVTLLTGRIPKILKVQEKYRQKKSTEKIGKGLLQIHRLWSPNFEHEGLIKRSMVYSLFLLECYFKILFSKNTDIIIGMHPYPPFFIPIILLSKFKKIKFVMEEADLWPDMLWELKIIENQTLYKLISKFSIWSYKLSDIVVVITEEIKDGLTKYFSSSKIEVLPLAVDTELFKSLNSSCNKSKKKFIVMYSGILSPNYDFDIILNAAKIIDNENIEFIISGQGELQNKIEKQILENDLDNLKIEPPVETIDEVVQKLNRADVLILGMHKNMQAFTAHPSKLFEFMACGKPIICSCIGAPRRLLESAKAGILIEPQDYHTFSKAIISLYESDEKRKTLGSNGRKFVEQNFSLNIFENKLQKILQKLF